MENEFEKKLSSENQKGQIVLNDDYVNEIISGLVDFAKGREAKMKTYSERYGIKKEELDLATQDKIAKLDQEVEAFNKILEEELSFEEKEERLKEQAQRTMRQLLKGQPEEAVNQRVENLLEMYQSYREMLKRKRG